MNPNRSNFNLEAYQMPCSKVKTMVPSVRDLKFTLEIPRVNNIAAFFTFPLRIDCKEKYYS